MQTTAKQSVPPPASSRGWNDEQFVNALVAWCQKGDPEIDLQSRRDWINPSVIKLLKDKVSHLIRVDIHWAVKLAELTRAAASLIADPESNALALHACALAMHFSGHYAEALNFYDRAEANYTRLSKEVEAARIGRAKMGVLMYLGKYEKALQTASRASEVFKRYNQSILLAQTQENIGSIYHHLDRYQRALTYYDRARKIYEAHQYEFGLASVSFNAAIQYTNLNEFERALSLYQQALRIYERLDLPLLVNETEYNLAWLYAQRGIFQESLRLFARVRARSQELGDTVQEAFCHLDLADLYLQLNAYEDAIDMARAAADEFGILEMNYETARAKMCLGVASMHRGNLTSAERGLEAARCSFLAEGNRVAAALSSMYLSDVFKRQHNWQQAVERCTEAQRIFVEQGLSAKAAHAQLQLIRLKLESGQLAQSLSLCQSVVGEVAEIEAPWLKFQSFHLLGNILEQAGQTEIAYRCYTKAVEYLGQLRSSIRVDELRWSFLSDKLKVYEDLVELCLQAGTKEKIEQALSYAEAAKSQTLAAQLAADRCGNRKQDASSSSQLHQELEKLRQELNWYYNRIDVYETRTPQQSRRGIDQLRKAAWQREQRLTKVVRQMRIEEADPISLQSVFSPNVTELRRALAEDEALVEYYLIGDRVKVFVLDRQVTRVFNDVTTVGAISSILRQLRFCFEKFALGEDFARTHVNSINAHTNWCLTSLYSALVEPVESLLEGKKIIFVPHGILHDVPFHALHDGREYLIDGHEISYCPSASVFKLCSEKVPPPARQSRMLIMGVPDEATPFIHHEVAAIQSLWPNAQLHLGDDATLERLKRQAAECRYLHLASHAIFRRDNPMFSALKLSDTWLSFYDVFNLKLNAELVTLSGCETGMNGIFAGDELLGLMRGFLYAGAPSLIVSLWIVNDRSTAELMRRLYSGLNRGLSKRDALRQAQVGVKQTHPHPYYWAPFILMGAPS